MLSIILDREKETVCTIGIISNKLYLDKKQNIVGAFIPLQITCNSKGFESRMTINKDHIISPYAEHVLNTGKIKKIQSQNDYLLLITIKHKHNFYEILASKIEDNIIFDPIVLDEDFNSIIKSKIKFKNDIKKISNNTGLPIEHKIISISDVCIFSIEPYLPRQKKHLVQHNLKLKDVPFGENAYSFMTLNICKELKIIGFSIIEEHVSYYYDRDGGYVKSTSTHSMYSILSFPLIKEMNDYFNQIKNIYAIKFTTSSLRKYRHTLEENKYITSPLVSQLEKDFISYSNCYNLEFGGKLFISDIEKIFGINFVHSYSEDEEYVDFEDYYENKTYTKQLTGDESIIKTEYLDPYDPDDPYYGIL